MDSSVCLYNHIPNNHNILAPIELWYHYTLKLVSNKFSNFHVWGLTTYVPEPKPQKSRVNIPNVY